MFYKAENSLQKGSSQLNNKEESTFLNFLFKLSYQPLKPFPHFSLKSIQQSLEMLLNKCKFTFGPWDLFEQLIKS